MRLFNRPNRVDASRAAELLERGQAVVLDVRENVEWKTGRIPGALHVPLDAYDALKAGDPNALSGVNLPEDRRVVTVCEAGNTSRIAAALLRDRGFVAQSLAGGMKAWARAGLPLDPPGGRVL